MTPQIAVRIVGLAALTCLVICSSQASSQTHDALGAQPRPEQAPRQQPKIMLAEKKAKGKEAPAEGGPMRTETTQFEQWIVTCQEMPGSKQPKACSALLQVVQTNKQIVLLWQLSRGNDGVVRSVVQTPTSVYVHLGAELKIGEEIVSKFGYISCVPQNCEAAGPLDEELIKRLAGAGEVTITIHARDGRDIHFKFPIKGIEKAIAALGS